MFDNDIDFSCLTAGIGDLDGDGRVDMAEFLIEDDMYREIMRTDLDNGDIDLDVDDLDVDDFDVTLDIDDGVDVDELSENGFDYDFNGDFDDVF